MNYFNIIVSNINIGKYKKNFNITDNVAFISTIANMVYGAAFIK